jgi:hypothetical protein
LRSELNRNWYARNRERVCAHVRSYREANAEKIREYDRNRPHPEEKNRRERERHRLKSLARTFEEDTTQQLGRKDHATVALATRGSTKHERERAREVLRRKGLL